METAMNDKGLRQCWTSVRRVRQGGTATWHYGWRRFCRDLWYWLGAPI